MKLIISWFLLTLCFIVWIEYSITNVLFRNDSSGQITIHISSMFNFLIDPLYNSTLWDYSLLDVNYIFFIVCCFSIYILYTIYYI